MSGPVSRRMFVGSLTALATAAALEEPATLEEPAEALELERSGLLELRPGDVLVAKLPPGQRLTARELVHIGGELRRFWPEVLVVEHGAEFEVLRRPDA